MIAWLEVLVLSTKSGVSLLAVSLGIAFGILHLWRARAVERKGHILIALVLFGIACACISYGALVLSVAAFESPGSDGQHWLRLYAQVAGIWFVLLTAAAAVIFFTLPSRIRASFSVALLLRSTAVFVPAAMVAFYVATSGSGTW